MPFLCNMGIHAYKEVGFEDNIRYGKLVAFCNTYYEYCPKCGTWRTTDPMSMFGNRRTFRINDVTDQQFRTALENALKNKGLRIIP